MPSTADNTGALAARLVEAPVGDDSARIGQELAELQASAAADPALSDLAHMLDEPSVAALLAGTMSGSPYLQGLIKRDLVRLQRILSRPPESHLAQLQKDLEAELSQAASVAEAMRPLRAFKSEIALLTALADLGGVWPVMQVTEALTATGDAALTGAVRLLFRLAQAKGDWTGAPSQTPDRSSGYIILGMGKYGARELNYSSDVDLIVFYSLDKLQLRDGLEPQAFFVRMTRDLVRLMQERTGDGYVFRTDLRLRPDAGATQVALSTDAAMQYYESFGQNWERAALIKARPVAGDIAAGEALLDELAPFVWRRHLDFAAIADIHAMKRQIHAFRGLGGIGVAGHNVKLGSGGIREIEFFVQTQQLIAGGRQVDLRTRATLETLVRLVERGWITEEVRHELEEAYLYLRRIEHRVQMVADEQTHVLPADPDKLESLARFAGYPDTEAFSAAFTMVLRTVRVHYSALFEDMPELTRGEQNMVFAGESDDPATLETLSRLGYRQPAQVIETVRGWHHGRYQAVRTARSREILTEVQPRLIETLADTADPDRAFLTFDRFLGQLPAGIQLFSLLRANPGLLRLVADIMGSAPRLAGILSRRRRLLDAVLDPRTFGVLPSRDELDTLIADELEAASDQQDALDRMRVVGSEQAFLIGVRILSGSVDAGQAGGAYALLAQALISATQTFVTDALQAVHGAISGGGAVVLAMGKLGGREMTAASDLDLIVVYDFDEATLQSEGERPLAPQQYYARFTQRLISALTAQTAEGALYEVDMRLRPSGQQGPVATQLKSFVEYQSGAAWTWEHMALTRARIVSGPEPLARQVEDAIRSALLKPRDRAKIAADVQDMRQRIWKEKGSESIWELKQVRGGLVDLEFMAQFLQLVNAAERPEVLEQNTLAAFQKLEAAGLLSSQAADVLVRATRLIHDLTQILRLCLAGPFDPASAPRGLKELLARAGDAPSFAALEADLAATLKQVHELFDEIVA